jgi:hypothetical protein
MFKYKYINRIEPDRKEINKYIAFDMSIHNALAEYNKCLLHEKGSFIILQSMLDKHWVDKGYRSILEESEYKKRAINLLKKYYDNPLDMGLDTIAIDKMLKLTYDSNLNLMAKIDKLHEANGNIMELIDYKTGTVLPPTNKMLYNMQIPITLILIENKYGFYPNLFSYYYLSLNRKFTFQIDDVFVQATRDYLAGIINEISCEEEYEGCTSPCNIP